MSTMAQTTLLLGMSGPGPQGPVGPQGIPGTNGTNGTNGTPGAAATIAIGTISTGAPGSTATVTNVGTSLAAIFNMSIPRGDAGATGNTGPAGPATVGSPNSRTLSLATAYQATDPSKPAIVTVNLTSTASFSLIGGNTNLADIVIGSTNAVAGGTGTAIDKYGNSSTATVAVGVGVTGVGAGPNTFLLPTGWYFAVRQTSGSVTITSAFDQSLG